MLCLAFLKVLALKYFGHRSFLTLNMTLSLMSQCVLKQQNFFFIFSLFQLKKRKTRGKSDKLLSNQPFFAERDEFGQLAHLQKAANASISNGMSVFCLSTLTEHYCSYIMHRIEVS